MGGPHSPGALCVCIGDECWRGDEWAVEVLTDVDLLGGGSTVGMLLSGHQIDGLPLTLHS